MEFKDPVKLKVYNLLENTEHIKSYLLEREFIEKWIQHQRDNVGCQFVNWEIVEI